MLRLQNSNCYNFPRITLIFAPPENRKESNREIQIIRLEALQSRTALFSVRAICRAGRRLAREDIGAESRYESDLKVKWIAVQTPGRVCA